MLFLVQTLSNSCITTCMYAERSFGCCKLAIVKLSSWRLKSLKIWTLHLPQSMIYSCFPIALSKCNVCMCGITFLSRLNCVQREMWSLIVCMYVVCVGLCMCCILHNWSLYPRTLMYSHGTWTQWSLGRVTHVTLTDAEVKGHLGVNDLWSSFWKKGHCIHICIHILWCIFMGLGHNDLWVESHMWPQQTWGQRSSRVQWPLVHFFFEKGSLYPHTLMYFHGT